jgi:hypothetical protein
MLVKLQRQDNYKGGDVQFWSKLIRRELVATRALATSNESDVTLKSGATAHVVSGTREVSGKHFGYEIAVVTNEKHVYTFEAWGPVDTFNTDHGALNKAIQSLDIGK